MSVSKFWKESIAWKLGGGAKAAGIAAFSDTSGNSIVLPSGAKYYLDTKTVVVPYSTGGDDSVMINSTIAAASALYTGGSRIELVFPRNQTYYADGITPGSNVNHQFGTCTFKKYSHATSGGLNGWFNNGNYLLGCYPIKDTINNTWFGAYNNIGLYGGFFDANGKDIGSSILYLVNIQDSDFDNMVTLTSSDFSTSSYYAIIYGGRRNRFGPGMKTLGGSNVGQDGMHVWFGSDTTWVGGRYEGGDDAIAFNMDGALAIPTPDGLLFDDLGIGPNLEMIGPRAYSMRAHAIRVDVPGPNNGGGTTQMYPGVTNLHKVNGVRITGVTGTSGVYRNGGVLVIDNGFYTADIVSRNIQNVDIDIADLTVFGPNHDDTLAYGVKLQNCYRVNVGGRMNLLDITNPTQAYQSVQLNNAAGGNALTLLTAGTTYNFTISINGAAAVTINILGSNALRFGNLISYINAQFVAQSVAATCYIQNTVFKFVGTGHTVGGTVAITGGTLFTGNGSTPGVGLRFYSSILTAVAGFQNNATTGTIINGTECNVSIDSNIPAGGGIMVTPSIGVTGVNSAGSVMHRDITIGGRLTSNPAQAKASLTVINTPGFICSTEFKDLNRLGSFGNAIKFFQNGLGPWPIVAITPGAAGANPAYGNNFTGTVTVAGDQTGTMPVNCLIQIAGNKDRYTNRSYTKVSAVYNNPNTVITVKEPISLTATVSGSVCSTTTAYIKGAKFAQSELYYGTIKASSAISNGGAGRLAYLNIDSACSFDKVDTPIILSEVAGDFAYDIANSKGLRTKYSGTVTVLNGTSSANVSLVGLLDIPLAGLTADIIAQQINIASNTDYGATAGRVWFTATDNQHIVIHTSANVTADTVFGFSVDTSTKLG